MSNIFVPTQYIITLADENKSQEFRLKIIETKNYFIEEINQNNLLSTKPKKFP